jgi:hypothetical protein
MICDALPDYQAFFARLLKGVAEEVGRNTEATVASRNTAAAES